jgi:V8-like Glu-specific endopeptidase
MSEQPSQGSGIAQSPNPSTDPILTLPTETEMEAVSNYTLIRPQEFDRETSYQGIAQNESGLIEAEPFTEEGSAGLVIDQPNVELLDAIYASYPELMASREAIEVIIGADNRVRINPTTSYPWRAICALKITAQNNTQWIGTGWLVSPRTVITAGHCVYMHDQGGWAKRIEVVPAQNGGLRPYGSGVSSNLRSVVGWTQSKNREYDYGAIILPSTYKPGNQTGYFGFAVRDDNYLKSAVLNLSGYPGDKGGNEQWFMAMQTKSVSTRVIVYNIDTMGGQSGAPVWVKVGNTRYCVGIHTNGHNSGNSATRIVQAVYNNIQNWKNQGL